jgi:ketosteroid isomerase-like protein
MSQANVYVIRKGFATWQRGDIDAWREMVDPEIEWDNSGYPAVGVPAGGSVVRASFGSWRETGPPGTTMR